MLKEGRLRSNIVELGVFLGISLLGILAIVSPSEALRITPNCLITALTGKHCWGCGITHASIACLHGDFNLAWQDNPLVFLVLPLLTFEYLRFAFRLYSSILGNRA